MTAYTTTKEYVAQHPIIVGGSVVLATLLMGVGFAFATGLTSPSAAFADAGTIVTITAPVVPPPPVMIPIPVTPIVPTVPVTVINTPTTPSTDNNKSNSNDNNSNSKDSNVGHTTDGDDNTEVTVVGQKPDTGSHDLPPCNCTGTTPPTIITTPPPVTTTDTGGDTGDTNHDLPPCCTTDTPTTPVLIPPTTPIIPVIPPVTTSAPLCDSLTADKSEIDSGDAVTLSWKTERATGISIDNGVGSVTPVDQGSTVVHPTSATTYTATVTGVGGTATCHVAVKLKTITIPAPQCISLTADKTEINAGDAVTLSWVTKNAVSISIDNGVGAVTPVDAGSTVVHPTDDTIYKATINGSGGTKVTCTVPVKIKTTHTSNPECVALTADKVTINPGDAVTLSWITKNASSVSIDNGVGNVTPTDSGSTVVHPTDTTTYTATVPNASVSTACQVQIVVTPAECTSGCGGGGGNGGGGHGGGGRGVTGQILTQVPSAAYVYLSQIPYTGLDLGPVGTVIYWVFLSLWCVALAYLVLFKVIPFIGMKLHLFGAGVSEVVNHGAAGAVAAAGAHAAGVAHIAASHGHESAVETHVTAPAHGPAPIMHAAPAAATGFGAFAKEGEALSIDDIVKGLSRESGATWQVGAFHQANAMPSHAPAHVEAPVYAAPVAHAPVAETRTAPVAAPLSADVRDFTSALLNDQRDVVFGTIRHIVREGGDAEAFLSQVVCAIDDAYRARVEGSYVHPEIAEITRGCATNFLERLVAALTNAVDSSYSVGVTGSKLALTRALAIIEG